MAVRHCAKQRKTTVQFLVLHWTVAKQFHHYLYGAPSFVVTTDHNPLTYVQTTAKLNVVGHRWMTDLGGGNFVINYKAVNFFMMTWVI